MSFPTQYVMCPPSTFTAKVPNNIFMEEIPDALRVVDKDKALEQWMKLYRYVSSKYPVNILPAYGDNQDIVFCANIGVNLDSHPNTVIVSNFYSEPRIDETNVGLDFFCALGYNAIRCPFFFEGKADLHKIAEDVYIGSYGMRTCWRALRWFEDTYAIKVIPIELTNRYLYHLDCSAFPLDDQNLLLVTETVSPETLKEIEEHVNVIPVPMKLGMAGATNAVRIDDTILINADPSYQIKVDFWKDLCRSKDLKLELFDLSEYEKGGGALSCLIMPLFKPII